MKTILITGGSGSLGRLLACRLSEHNKVVITGTDEDRLAQSSEQAGCRYRICDVTDPAALASLVGDLGEINCLINNAALSISGSLSTNDPGLIARVVAVNVTGLILCTQAVVPQMVARGTGLIINIGSQAGVQPQGNSPVYAATKWAVRGFTLSMAEQLATDGVAVVGIYPGRLTTSMVTNDGVAHHKEQAAHGEEVARCVEFVLSLELPTTVTELGIKQLLN